MLIVKILSWNCNGGLRSKIDRALALDADVVVIQEAHDPAHYQHRLVPGSLSFWNCELGANKGVFVWTRPGWDLKPHPAWSPDVPFHHMIPMVVNPPDAEEITVWAVWTRTAKSLPFEDQAVGQAHEAMDALEHILGPRTVLIGDFNSNAIWDKDRTRNHSVLVQRLDALGIRSAYHERTAEQQGSESLPTYWHQRRAQWPFHLDYAFLSKDLAVSDFWIGSREDWCMITAEGGVSDHAPILVTISES